MFDIDTSILDSERKDLEIDSDIDRSLYGSPEQGLSLLHIRDDEFISLENRKALSAQITVHNDDVTVYRIIRDGKPYEWRNEHRSYRQCSCAWAQNLRERELKMSTEDVHLSGSLQNMSHEDFTKFFNMDIEKRVEYKDQIEGTLKELLRYLFCEDKTPVSELRKMASSGNPEEREQAYKILGDRIHINETAKNILSVWIHKDKSIQYDINEEAKDEERKRLREHDKKYKPKPVPKEEDKKAKVTQTKNEKMRATLMMLAPSEMKAKGKEKELNDWIDKMIVDGRNPSTGTKRE